jgi:hypothetical protein
VLINKSVKLFIDKEMGVLFENDQKQKKIERSFIPYVKNEANDPYETCAAGRTSQIRACLRFTAGTRY